MLALSRTYFSFFSAGRLGACLLLTRFNPLHVGEIIGNPPTLRKGPGSLGVLEINPLLPLINPLLPQLTLCCGSCTCVCFSIIQQVVCRRGYSKLTYAPFTGTSSFLRYDSLSAVGLMYKYEAYTEVFPRSEVILQRRSSMLIWKRVRL